MDKQYLKIITDELQISTRQVERSIELLENDNTIPFIARYRKEMTGNLDEEQLRIIEKHLEHYKKMQDRKSTVLKTIEEAGKLTSELKEAIEGSWDSNELEDLYLPYKPKKRTRAMMAREKGLEGLALAIHAGEDRRRPEEIASEYLNSEIPDTAAALQGASDILAEMIAEEAAVRAWVRQMTQQEGLLVSKAKDSTLSSEFEMYYEFAESIESIPSHRILAMNRGENKDLLKVSVNIDSKKLEKGIFSRSFDREHPNAAFLKQVITDSYKRLIAPAIERELRKKLTEAAEEKAIEVFSKNLYQLLMQPPVRGRVILGIDPGYRTGCKAAVIDDTGRYLEGATIYPTPPREDKSGAEKKLLEMIGRHEVMIIAIGNGTASRETSEFVAEMIDNNALPLQFTVVSEAGASVYSASPLAKEEFPDLDASLRGNISIARRLQDPLAELVKIDPKAIGVGQYQHDVDQKELAGALGHTVVTAVNQVGVDVNTASEALLTHVSGLNRKLAKSMTHYIQAQGALSSREELKKIPGIGTRTFEQAAGFLKIYQSKNLLDHTNIHPESYGVTKKLFKLLDLPLKAESRSELKFLHDSAAINISELAGELEVGTETLSDIINAFIRPDRDPREDMPPVLFKQGVLKIEDLKEGSKVKGTIQNVTDFGAFLDIGLKHAGLIHISKLARRFVKNPHDVVKVGEVYEATVISLDLKRNRIGLSLID